MMRIFLIGWLCAFTLFAGAAFGVSMLGCMLRLGNSDLWIAWRSAFVAASRSTLVIALLYVPILLGIHELYPWAEDAEFANQRWFLSTPFAIGRAIVYFVASIAASRLALAEGKGAIPKTAVALLILFFTAHLAAVDWLMALTPKWHSSVIGLRWIVDGLLTGAAMIAFWRAKADSGTVPDALRRRIDGANLLFALHLGWLYLMFVDYITAWSGNLPDEANWYVARLAGGWWQAIVAIVACHVLLCAILLMRGTKRSAGTLLGIAALTIALQWLEAVWTIAPGSDSNITATAIVSLIILALWAAIATFAAHLHSPATTHREAGLDG